MNLFFLVLAKDGEQVYRKIEELKALAVSFLVVCGKPLKHPNVVYREPKGKYDAINFGMALVPRDVDIVVLNDVDTVINNFKEALSEFISDNDGLLYGRVSVKEGPQRSFYPLIDSIRRRIPIAASGELLIVRRDILDSIIPLKPCKAEDSYILFKTMELKRRVAFCEKCYVQTNRTKTAKMEEAYKRKTVCGIYQALSYTNPSIPIKLFYSILPLISPLLLVSGKNGYYTMKGILMGWADFVRGNREGTWQTTYMK
jgi:cellulose synthase/poly-beta-1,6-N-acetylglucosamine synthase-like glycosyltransferase